MKLQLNLKWISVLLHRFRSIPFIFFRGDFYFIFLKEGVTFLLKHEHFFSYDRIIESHCKKNSRWVHDIADVRLLSRKEWDVKDVVQRRKHW